MRRAALAPAVPFARLIAGILFAWQVDAPPAPLPMLGIGMVGWWLGRRLLKW